MFKYLKELLALKPIDSDSLSSQPYVADIEGVTVESLWDDYQRRTWSYDYASASLRKSNPRLLNWIGSIDQSGYTRQKCLEALIANPEPGDENRILLRLEDWVPQVQGLAKDWVIANFSELSFDAIRANQHLILYLSRKARLQNDAGLNEIKCDLLERAKTMTSTKFFSLNAMFRRFLFSLSLEGDEQIRPWILDDPEPFNRLLLLSGVPYSEISADEKARLSVDRSIFVRRRLFQTKLDSGITPERNELVLLALDPSLSMRERGRFYLKSIYGEECYTIYKAKGCDEFFYIADYARREDAEHFLEGARSGSKATKQNCIRALVAAAPECLRELNISEMIAQNRKIRSLLVPVLTQLLTVDEILSLRCAFERSSPNGAVAFFRVLEKKSFWIFVDEGLSLLLSEPKTALSHSIILLIQSRVEIHESLPVHLWERINTKIIKLRDGDQKRNEDVINLLEFTLKTSTRLE